MCRLFPLVQGKGGNDMRAIGLLVAGVNDCGTEEECYDQYDRYEWDGFRAKVSFREWVLCDGPIILSKESRDLWQPLWEIMRLATCV